MISEGRRMKGRQITTAKTALVVTGRRLGASADSLADLTGLSLSNISRRYDAAISRLRTEDDLAKTIGGVTEQFAKSTKSQA